MKTIHTLFVIIITIVLYILISLISFHYYYFVPELHLLGINSEDIVGTIEIIDTIETIIILVLIVCLYFLCFKIYTKKSYSPSLLIISNLLLLIIGLVLFLYWETEFFYTLQTDSYNGYTYYGNSSRSYEFLKLFTFNCLLTSLVLNIHFISRIVSSKKKYQYLIVAFIPVISLLFLRFGSFLNSKNVIWIKNGNSENKVNHKDFLNLDFNDDTPIWYKGLDEWITYKEFKLRTPLSMIK